jgi:hypothetical protein
VDREEDETLNLKRRRGRGFAGTFLTIAALGLVAAAGASGQASLSLTPASKDFGFVGVGLMSSAQTFTLTNEGNAPAMVDNPSVDDPATFPMTLISPTFYPFTISAAGTATVEVSFGPDSDGPKSATLTFTSDAPDSPETAALSGTGGMPMTGPIPVVPQEPPKKKCKKRPRANGATAAKKKCKKRKR